MKGKTVHIKYQETFQNTKQNLNLLCQLLLFRLFQNINQLLPGCLRGQLTCYEVNPTPPRHSSSSFRQAFVPAQASEMHAGT